MEMHPEEPHRPLPQSVQQIADIIGRDQALKLIDELPRKVRKCHPSGEAILYVPKTLTTGHRLATILGDDDARRLVDAFGGEILYPAACHALRREQRNGAIREALKQGSPIAAIAALHRITARHVRNIAREFSPEDQAQAGMQHAA